MPFTVLQCVNKDIIINYPDYNKTHLNHLIPTQWIHTTHVIILIPLHSYYSTIAADIHMYYNPKRVLCADIVKLLQNINLFQNSAHFLGYC